MRLRYTGRAKDDLDIAFEWYEWQRRGLGFEFLDCVEAAIETTAWQCRPAVAEVQCAA